MFIATLSAPGGSSRLKRNGLLRRGGRAPPQPFCTSLMAAIRLSQQASAVIWPVSAFDTSMLIRSDHGKCHGL